MSDDYAAAVKRMLEEDCSKFIESRGELSYLSWASAWDRVLREDPSASYTVLQWDTGPVQRMPCGGWMAWVDVTIHGKTRRAYLPVMDHRNKAIPEPDAFAINKAIQRCLAKGIAMHGLGLYVYRGEDLPTTDSGDAKVELVSEENAANIEALMEEVGADESAFLKYFKIDSVRSLLAKDYARAVKMLESKRGK